MPLNCGMFGLADMPVANTSCFGLSVISCLRARRRRSIPCAVVPIGVFGCGAGPVVQLHDLVYISSQSPILSLGENTGQFFGKSM